MWNVYELSGLLFDLDKYTTSKGGAKSRLLSSHTGGNWQVNRLSNPDRNIYIKNAYVSIFGGIQPDMMSKAFDVKGNTDIDCGFLPRFLFIRATSKKPALWNDTAFDEQSKRLLETITSTLLTWEVPNNEQDAKVEMTDEAKEVYKSWYDEVVQQAHISTINGAWLRKLNSHALRLCLLLHSLDVALGSSIHYVDDDCMERALLLANWLKTHQEQCWQLFMLEGRKKQVNTVEHALMSVVVKLASARGNDWDITNKELFPLVKKELGTNQVKDNVLGKAANKLGLKSCWIRETERGRRVTKTNILHFKETVGVVGNTTDTRLSEDD